EAAMLAALPKLPSYYNPRTHPDRAVRRRNVVLGLMRDQGFLTPEESELWRSYPLVLTSNRTSYGDIAPYFVEWLRQQLDARFGRDLYEGGLRIYTTLDLDMQEAAERALQSQLDAVEAGVYSNGKFPGRTTYREYIESSRASGEDHGPFSPYLQGALVALEATTGYIRAMIGGRDFDDSKFNRAWLAVRQPGSTFKPFVYSAAVRAGHPVTEMVDDSPLNPPVIQLDSTLWQPKDDDDTTLGLIPMREGLYLSRKIATIKLGMALGEQTVIGEARRYGITTPLPPYPSIHIGARGVRPIEMIAAYTAFATLGTRAEPVGVLRVEDRQGNILWQPAIRREPVMDPEHTWLMVDMMKDVIRRGTAFTAVWKAGFTLPAAGKTGTTDDYTDAWFIGYTPELVTGVWVGYDIPQRILEHNAGGGKIVAPAWTAFMRDVYDRRPRPPDWVRPDSGLSGTRAVRHRRLAVTARVLRLRARSVHPVTAPPIADGAVLVDDRGKLAAVGPAATVPAPVGARQLEFPDGAIVPGLVNCHTHLELTHLAGRNAGRGFPRWIRTIRALKDATTPEEFSRSAEQGVRDGWARGITCIADTGSSGAVLPALSRLGGRGIAYHEVFGPDPHQADASLAQLEKALSQLEPFVTSLAALGISPHAPYTVSAPLYRAAAALARRDHFPIAVHIAESQEETLLVRDGLGPFAEALWDRGIAVARQ